MGTNNSMAEYDDELEPSMRRENVENEDKKVFPEENWDSIQRITKLGNRNELYKNPKTTRKHSLDLQCNVYKMEFLDCGFYKGRDGCLKVVGVFELRRNTTKIACIRVYDFKTRKMEKECVIETIKYKVENDFVWWSSKTTAVAVVERLEGKRKRNYVVLSIVQGWLLFYSLPGLKRLKMVPVCNEFDLYYKHWKRPRLDYLASFVFLDNHRVIGVFSKNYRGVYGSTDPIGRCNLVDLNSGDIETIYCHHKPVTKVLKFRTIEDEILLIGDSKEEGQMLIRIGVRKEKRKTSFLKYPRLHHVQNRGLIASTFIDTKKNKERIISASRRRNGGIIIRTLESGQRLRKIKDCEYKTSILTFSHKLILFGTYYGNILCLNVEDFRFSKIFDERVTTYQNKKTKVHKHLLPILRMSRKCEETKLFVVTEKSITNLEILKGKNEYGDDMYPSTVEDERIIDMLDFLESSKQMKDFKLLLILKGIEIQLCKTFLLTIVYGDGNEDEKHEKNNTENEESEGEYSEEETEGEEEKTD